MCTGRGGVLSHFCILSFHVELTMNPGLPRKFPVYSYFYRSIDSMPPYSKNGNDNPVCKIAKETPMYRIVFWTLAEGEGGMIWENGIDTCIISYMKQIASPGSMHDTGCWGLVHWDDPEG